MKDKLRYLLLLTAATESFITEGINLTPLTPSLCVPTTMAAPQRERLSTLSLTASSNKDQT